MAQPRTYTRQYNFNDFQTTSPSDPLPGSQVDGELNSVKLTLDDINTNIAKIQQDDGKIKNQAVHKDSFDAGALALMKTGSYTIKGDWVTATSYSVSDLVDYNGATYIATSAHTSSSAFQTDLDANKWILIANAGIASTASAVDKFEGTGSQTAFTLTYSYSSNTDVLVFVNGVIKNPGDDYSISGTTLTFVTAPSTPAVSGNENVIVWGASVVAQAAKQAAETANSNAQGFANEADGWARKTNGLVESTDYSSKAYAIGGTGVDNGSGSAKDWATKTSGTVGNTSDYSAKYYATNANVGTVATNIADVNTVAGQITPTNNISSVADFRNSVLVRTFFVTINSSGNIVLDGLNSPHLGGDLFKGYEYTFDFSDSSCSTVTSFQIMNTSYWGQGSAIGASQGFTITGTFGQAGCKAVWKVPQNGTGGTINGQDVGRYRINSTDSTGNGLSVKADPYQRLGNDTMIDAITEIDTGVNMSRIATVGHSPNMSDINDVADNITAVNTLAGIDSAITAVNNNSTAITNVNNALTAINNVNSDLTAINAVNSNSTNINAVSSNQTNINAVNSNATNINAVANNIDNVNSFAARYRVQATEPSTSLDEGDLWYDTGNNVLKIWDTSTNSFLIVQQTTDYTSITSTYTKAQIASTFSGTLSSVSGVLDFDTYNNFIVTLSTGVNTLANPTTEAGNVGQTGVIVFRQPSSGSLGTVSLQSDYETPMGSGLTLGVEFYAYDIVPYFILTTGRIFLGTPQRTFS